MKIFLFTLFRLVLNAVYLPLKFFPQKDKITFLSRQGDEPGVDFLMLTEEMKHSYPQYVTVVLCRKLGNGIFNKIAYGFHILRQMYHIATAKVAVLDSYCIAVSLLNHKKNLKVFQIWHALGLFKHFGYTAIGKKEGSSEFTAKAMRMHRNYDYVICSGDDLVSDIAAAYDISPSKVIPLGLPRMDYLLSETVREHNYDKIIGAYPYIDNGRKNILYVPTFRKTAENKFMLLVDNIDFREYNLIVKLHDGKELVYVDKEICGTGESAFGMDFLHIADAVITDYSAIIFEAALLKKPIYLYCYDYASYMENRGLYIDYMSLPMVISEDIKTIINAVEQDDFDKNKISAFLKRNIPYCNIDITKTLCSMFVQAAEGKNVFDVEYIVKFDKLL